MPLAGLEGGAKEVGRAESRVQSNNLFPTGRTLGFGYSFVRFGVTFTQPAALVAPRLMLDPDEALHYLSLIHI